MEYISVDLLLIVLLICFTIAGFWFGFLHTVGALLGTFLGAFLASRFYGFIGDWLILKYELSENTAKVLGFILIFIIVSRSFGIAVWLIERFIDMSGLIPFFGLMNRSAGAVVGLVEGVLILGLILTFTMKFPISETWKNRVEKSNTAQSTIYSSKILWPIVESSALMLNDLPDSVQNILPKKK